MLGDYALLLQGWTGSLSVGWNTPAWSLSCEFFFYLCFPLLFLWLRGGRMGRTLLALGGSLVTPILLAHAGVPTNWKPIHHLSDFLAGIAAAGIYNAIARSGFAPKWLGTAMYLSALTAGAAFIIYPARARWHADEPEYGSSPAQRRPADRVGIRRRLCWGGHWRAMPLVISARRVIRCTSCTFRCSGGFRGTPLTALARRHRRGPVCCLSLS